jgi:tetratricopeptide (TPR) repeat protein
MWADRGENLPEAEQFILRALELNPHNGAYIDSLGWVYYHQGRYTEALAELLRAAELLTTPDPVVYEHIGDVCSKLGQTAEAIAYWQKASQLAPENTLLTEKIDRHAARLARQPSQATRPSNPP